MKKLLSLVIILAITLSVFAGCGQKKTENAPKPTEAPKTETKAEPKKEVNLRMAIWGNDERKKVFEGLAADFTAKNPNVKVEVVLIPFGEFQQKISIQMASKSAPDVIWLAEKMIPQFVETNQLLDISKLKSDAEFDYKDIFPSTLELYDKGDKLYGIGFAMGPRVMFYNKTLFKEKGLKTPMELHKEGKWTYDELYKTAKALTDSSKGIYGLRLFPATAPKDWANALYDMVWSYGGDFFTPDMTKVAINSPEGIKAIQMYYDMLFKDEVHPKPGDQLQFESGKIGMVRDTFSSSATFRKVKDFEWDMAPNPVGPNAKAPKATGLAGYSIYTGTKYPEESLALLKYFTSKEIMTKLASTFPCPRKSVLESDAFMKQPNGLPTPEAIKASFVDPIASGLRTLPYHKNYQQIDIKMQSLFDLLYTKSMTVEQVVKKIEDEVNPLMK